MRMKRHLPGLYTIGDWAINRECYECTGYCGGKWVIRPVIEWDETGFPELGDYGPMANTKAELVDVILRAKESGDIDI